MEKIEITFDVYSPLLKRTFRHTRLFDSLDSFKLHAYALYSGNWTIISQRTVIVNKK